jgi:hypothetical protein
MTAVDELRRSNRFYAHQIGLLDEHPSRGPFSLSQARGLYESAAGHPQGAEQSLSAPVR